MDEAGNYVSVWAYHMPVHINEILSALTVTRHLTRLSYLYKLSA